MAALMLNCRLLLLTAAVIGEFRVNIASDVTKPNIVLMIADDLGIGDVGCFGNDTMKTPGIDRIAREGVKLTHHLTAEALCTPSRAAFMTGRYPVRSGMVASHILRVTVFVSSTSGLPSNEITFAEVAKQNGYRTALIGKWHLGVHCSNEKDFCHHPLNHGFDYFYGVPLSNIKDFGNEGAGIFREFFHQHKRDLTTLFIGVILLAAALRKFRILSWKAVWALLALIFIPSAVIYFVLTNLKMMNSLAMRNYDIVEQPLNHDNLSQRLVTEGVKFMEDQNAAGKPFLLTMSWVQVHTVLHASEQFRGHSQHGEYGDNVEELDWSTGQIVDALERLGILNNTLVYFTSDHGGHLEEKGVRGEQHGGWNGIYRGGKGQGGMEGGIRVPAVAMWPGHIPPGSVVDVPTSLMDIFPTVSAVLSSPLPSDRIIDGRNIYPLLTGDDPRPPHRFLIHYCGTEIHAVRYVPGNGSDVYKVLYVTPNWLPGTFQCLFLCHCYGRHVTYHDPPLLYNIARDPAETQPLPVADYNDVMQTVQQALNEHKNSVDRTVPDQFSLINMLPRPWLQPCCNFPSCECSDPEYS